MTKKDYFFIFLSFLIWRIGLFAVLLLAIKFVPLQINFLGGNYGNYIKNPMFWAWGNYDGQRYTSIAQNGYGTGELVYFPIYPFLIKFLSQIFGNSLFNLNLIGQIMSNSTFVIALIGFYKLLRIDFSEKITKIAVISLLVFPTSFYFASVYTESIFFALLVWIFYFARTKKWFLASIFGILISATRVTGVFVFLSVVIEWFIQNKKWRQNLNNFPIISLTIPSGLIGYMYYIYKKTGDFLAFYSQQAHVGQHRSSHIITLPQVYYRYIFEIFPNLNLNYFPIAFTTILEFLLSTIFFFISLVLFFKSRLSYAVYAFIGVLLPTFLGSFSSMPRYVLVIFPVFILLAQYLSKSKSLRFAFYSLSLILLIISFSMFARGYWLS